MNTLPLFFFLVIGALYVPWLWVLMLALAALFIFSATCTSKSRLRPPERGH